MAFVDHGLDCGETSRLGGRISENPRMNVGVMSS